MWEEVLVEEGEGNVGFGEMGDEELGLLGGLEVEEVLFEEGERGGIVVWEELMFGCRRYGDDGGLVGNVGGEGE